MKTLRKVAMAVMSLFLAVSLTACGDDDDDAPAAPGSGYFTFDDARHDASYGYILYDEDLVDILCFNKDRWHLIIIRKSKFRWFPERSVQFSGKRTKRSVQKKGCTQHL